MNLFPAAAGASLSVCGQYRYRLWREWDARLPTVVFLMLNPSAADASVNDPTIIRCIGFARDWGFGRMEVVNLYPLRATNPAALREHVNPLGPGLDADVAIMEAVHLTKTIVCAYGRNLFARKRATAVLHQLAEIGFSDRLYHIGLNQDGSPKHPLYIAASVRPQRWVP